MKYIIFIIISIFCSSCCGLLPGDGAFRVVGSTPPNNECELLLFDENGNELDRSSKLSGNFNETFVVSPCKQKYVIKCLCDSIIVKEVFVEYGVDATLEPPYNIGKIKP